MNIVRKRNGWCLLGALGQIAQDKGEIPLSPLQNLASVLSLCEEFTGLISRHIKIEGLETRVLS
jgi:hypothetical protein